MEELTEQIAAEIGPKWVQLLSRLQLDYRERYRLCAKHKDVDKTLQEANCTRDTIRLWQKGVGDIPESEVVTQLLAAFRTVKGFEERARELAESRGISLDLPQPPTTSSQESQATEASNSNAASGTEPTALQSPLVVPHTKNTTHTPSPSTHRHSLESVTGSSAVKAATEDTSSDALTSVSAQPSFVAEQHPSSYRAHSPALSIASSTGKSEEQLLSMTVDISVMKHKFVLLDVSQRLPSSTMNEFARRLSVSHERVQQINTDFKRLEERYYQVLKCWLEGEGEREGRTFVELRRALEACHQQTASDIVLRRLQSPGLTLRSPKTCSS